MFEFHYSVALDIVHPSADARMISQRITTLPIINETTAGEERMTRAGKPIIPARKAMYTHWAATLHEEERIYSGTVPLNEFVKDKISELKQYRELFWELAEQGQVVLSINWFSVTNHSAERLDVETLKGVANLGLGIELNYYAPFDDASFTAGGGA